LNHTKNTTHRTLATLSLPKQVGALITYTQNIVMRMTGNANFTTPVPALTAVTTACNELQTAETAALARTKGAVAIRNEKRTALVALLQQLRAYVQSIADGNVENGTSIIESAGIAVRKPVVRKPRVFNAVPGAVSGTAKLIAASAGPRSSYEWEFSTDGGKTWVTQPVTIQARTTVLGLMPGASVQFRYKPVTAKGGEGDWSQPVALTIK
jgi:hypothetical protein